jgi:hypothetical protein
MGHEADSVLVDPWCQPSDAGVLSGRGRIWGSGSLTLSVWAGLDPGRPRRREGFLIDCGRHTKPLITPEDPGSAEGVLREHLAAGVVTGAGEPLARGRSSPASEP